VTPSSAANPAGEAEQDAESNRRAASATGRTGKKVAAAITPPPRPHVNPPPPKPPATRPSRPSAEATPVAPATAPPAAKKGDALNDYFNDTK